MVLSTSTGTTRSGSVEPTAEVAGEEVSTEPLAARAPVRDDSPRFADLGVHPSIVRALADVGITRTFAIQEMALPIAMAGHDLIGQARTGTGKTLGFGIPLLEGTVRRPDGPDDGRPHGLVVVPTRELALQVTHDIAAAGKYLKVRCVAIYGGRAYEPQVAALRRGVDIVVGTPGRLLDLAQQGHLDLAAVARMVLDEADEMLDLGFLPDIERILAMVPEQRQTMLFSATMPGPIVALARRFMRQPTQIRAQAIDERSSLPPVRQFAYRAHAMDKVEMLARILQSRGRGLTILFCRTKRTAAKIADELRDRGFAAAAVHGDLGQGARERALRAFRAGKVDVLVATDVAARGIDVEAVTHVINHQCPEDEKVYLHRIGRTARAGATGTAITLVDWDDLPRWRMVCDRLDLPLHEPPETYSTSEHLYVDLDIPPDASGTLPQDQRVRAGLAAEDAEDVGETGAGRPRSRRRTRRPAQRRERSGGARVGGTGAEDEARLSTPGSGRRRRRTRRGVPVESLRSAEPTEGSAPSPAASADGGAPQPGPARVPGRGRRRRRRRSGAGAARVGEPGGGEGDPGSPGTG